MPIYEYQCEQCGELSEILQKISDPPATTCPHCHKAALKQLVSAAGFQLKGTGWYVTDFRDKDKKTTETPAATKPEKKEPNSDK